MNFYCYKLSNAPNEEYSSRFCQIGNEIEIMQLNQLTDKIQKDDMVFIFFGGDKVSWDKGLVGIATVVDEPYDIGYDGGNNFKIKVKMEIVLNIHLKREYFIRYRDVYNAGGIGPSTKGEQNQAIKLLTEKQAISIMRGMLDSENEIYERLKEIIDANLFEKVIGEVEILENKKICYNKYINRNLDYLYKLENKEFAFNCINLLKPVWNDEIASILTNKELLREKLNKSYTYPILKEVINDDEVIQICYDNNDKQRYYFDIIEIKEKKYVITNDWRRENPDNMTPFVEFILNTINDSKGENIIFYGVPGSGKSYTINKEYCNDDNFIERVVFHPEYSYNDFVGQLLPKLDEKKNPIYTFIPGPFTRILKKAYQDKNNNHYYLIIEELNRGNAPAIFGDIFQLLDRNKKGESIYCITNYDIAKEIFDDEDKKIKIPSNLSILATINTSDQNIFTLDTAFKRRWKMKLIENNIDKCLFANDKIVDSKVTWKEFVNTINDLIIENNDSGLSNEDKRLGAYFLSKEEFKDELFAEKVLTYLWDDVFKLEREQIFKTDKYKTLEDLIKGFKLHKFDVFKNIFKEE